jgi:hypothetical protein
VIQVKSDFLKTFGGFAIRTFHVCGIIIIFTRINRYLHTYAILDSCLRDFERDLLSGCWLRSLGKTLRQYNMQKRKWGGEALFCVLFSCLHVLSGLKMRGGRLGTRKTFPVRGFKLIWGFFVDNNTHIAKS